MLHVDSISKFFREHHLLKDIYIACGPGEVLGILGRNGSGKSTLLKIIARQETSDYSYVRADDKVLLTARQTAKYINYLPQVDMLPQYEKVEKILRLTLSSDQYVELTSHPLIAPLLSSKCGLLSGGEARFIAALIVLHTSVPYTLLDEPFSGISPVLRDQMIDIIKHKKQNKGIIITDHDYRNVLKVADKIILIKDGKSILINSRDDLIEYGYLVR